MSSINEVYSSCKRLTVQDIIKKYSNIQNVKSNPTISWTGFKELVLIEKVKECDDIISFYFKANDGSKLIKHKAGQFLPFKIKTDNLKYKDVIRTYSLSIKPNDDIYRISVKRVPGGLISNYLHDELQVGDIIEAMPPAGIFTLKEDSTSKPLVLISAGIGITPLISMLYDSGNKFNEIHFIQAVQNSNIQPFNRDIVELSKLYPIKNHIFYSNPLASDKLGKDYQYTGYVTKDWIENNLPLNSEFYFCGPPPFMKGINKALLELNVSKDNIHFEFFGPPQDME